MSNMILRERRNTMIGVLFYIFFVLLAVLGCTVLEGATGIFQAIAALLIFLIAVVFLVSGVIISVIEKTGGKK
jgi:quinol-cytochrome oxidoreductase complex cytochrome b subunit